MVFILGKTSGKQFDMLSIIISFKSVFYKSYTIVWDPMNPNPPGTSKVLNWIIFFVF